ncbi:hypothetical protein B0H17DRAFT_1105516 [Mycena rosella]|uniref:Uncharacterized protein n=1 Tax=Mycena rosella TaxID=1033263 RepID=A0AAD7FVN5_MYCRO|nr:hypothetical protein B0H17DRAFT_1105516 [Mycena rosella]
MDRDHNFTQWRAEGRRRFDSSGRHLIVLDAFHFSCLRLSFSPPLTPKLAYIRISAVVDHRSYLHLIRHRLIPPEGNRRFDSSRWHCLPCPLFFVFTSLLSDSTRRSPMHQNHSISRRGPWQSP